MKIMQMSQQSRLAVAVEASALFALAFSIRLIDLDSAFSGNELFHILAARSWVEDGTFRVAHGAYSRSGEFTAFIGVLVRVFGENPVVVRFPSVIAGSLTVVALFLWLRLVVGRVPAWFASLIFCSCGLAIAMSQWLRVYSTQALFFFLGAVGVYALMTQRFSRTSFSLIAISSIGLLWTALHLHLVTIVGLGGLALWVVIEARDRLVALGGRIVQNRLALLSATALAVIGVILVFLSGEFEQLVGRLRDVQPQAAYRQGDLLFYHNWLIRQYPLFWGVIPLAVVTAIVRKPRFGLFCSCIFLTVFAVYAFASRKQTRYLYYVLPYLFALWGFVLAEALPYLRRIVAEMLDKLGVVRDRLLIRRLLAGCIFGMIAVFILSTNDILKPVYYKISGTGSIPPDWKAAESVLSPWLSDQNVIVLAAPMQQPLYFYGRADIEFGPKYIYESDTGKEFGFDRRTGLRAVSTRESMELVFRCNPRGLFIMDSSKWRRPGFGPSDDVVELLQQTADELAGVKKWGLTAFAWDLPRNADASDCSVLQPWDGGT